MRPPAATFRARRELARVHEIAGLRRIGARVEVWFLTRRARRARRNTRRDEVPGGHHREWISLREGLGSSAQGRDRTEFQQRNERGVGLFRVLSRGLRDLRLLRARIGNRGASTAARVIDTGSRHGFPTRVPGDPERAPMRHSPRRGVPRRSSEVPSSRMRAGRGRALRIGRDARAIRTPSARRPQPFRPRRPFLKPGLWPNLSRPVRPVRPSRGRGSK